MTAPQVLARTLRATAWLGGGVFLIALAAGVAGARVNTTPSIPLGLYWVANNTLRVGEYALVCPPQTAPFLEARDRGYLDVGACPGGYGYMMKRIAATSGAHVHVSDRGVEVDGRLLPKSKRLATDPQGRVMPRYVVDDYTLATGQVLLMTDDNPLSFDARYYGPIAANQVRALLRPVLTEGTH